MLYLIGGAARAGKTILARRLLREHNVPCFCVDYFVSALEAGSPELGIVGESYTRTKAAALWPRLEPLLVNIVLVEPAYTVEGDSLHPRGVASLAATYPGQVRALFLGYAATTPERKLAEIRRFAGHINDWIQHHTDGYVLELAREMIEFSTYVRDECQACDIPYIDLSEDFSGGIEKAYRLLHA